MVVTSPGGLLLVLGLLLLLGRPSVARGHASMLRYVETV